jgi:hypothetical protein
MTQPGDLDGYLDRYRQSQLARRLQDEFPQPCAQLPASALNQLVHDGCLDALALDITAPGDIHRFLKLSFLPNELLQSSFFQSVLIRILNNREVSGAGRLDLIDWALNGRLPRRSGT